ncbi:MULTISPECIES: cyclic nucleotide-binding/CBS domain-containing protein [Natrinema]|uniref:CBS domain containing protein n=1 Tax=Natrinema gari JCM 14663 TaxID=1230459 RepID=L9YR85_9EURY|nr:MULTISPECIES: CBS domain-containing protein [Natrinema]AFO58525.1 CBS domain containing protein [Natrinema sp. J7-2]ELY75423.1 CBS domain containing protein [Natrinema gari JCM 14663]
MESELSVRDVLTSDYVGVSESDTVREVVRLMREERTSCALVVRGAEPVGIVTEWDVLGLVADDRDPSTTTVGDAMTTPVITVGPDRSLTDVATTMARQNIRNVVVEAADGIVGLVTQRDVIAAAGSFQATMTPSRSSEPPVDRDRDAADPAAARTTEGDDTQLLPNGGDEYTTQGICEACGSLADALWDANGQLVCTDCRTV